MARSISATCSECFNEQAIDLNPRRTEIVCAYCKHSVPMFDSDELREINSVKAAEQRKSMIALLTFIAAAVLFGLYAYIESPEPTVVIEIDGGVNHTGTIRARTSTEIVFLAQTEEGVEEISIIYSEKLKGKIATYIEEHPGITKEDATRLVVSESISPAEAESSAISGMLLLIAISCAVVSLVFGGMACQRTIICEF